MRERPVGDMRLSARLPAAIASVRDGLVTVHVSEGRVQGVAACDQREISLAVGRVGPESVGRVGPESGSADTGEAAVAVAGRRLEIGEVLSAIGRLRDGLAVIEVSGGLVVALEIIVRRRSLYSARHGGWTMGHTPRPADPV